MSRRNFVGVLFLMLVAAAATCGIVWQSAVTAVAQEPQTQVMGTDGVTAIDITGIQNGQYVLTIRGGVATISPLTLLTLTPGPGPGPNLQPNDELSKAVIAEVNKIPASDQRHGAALKLSKTLEMLADQTIPANKTVEATNTIVKLALGSDATTWSAVTARISEALSKCTTEAQADAVLDTAANAVMSTIPASMEASNAELAKRFGIDWDVFLKFIMELIVKLLPLLIT